jgi:hypothetical protein
VDCQLNVQQERAGQHIQLHFSHDECSRVIEVPEILTALYPISHHPQLWNFTYAQKKYLTASVLPHQDIYKKRLTRTSHELFSYFTETVLSSGYCMDPHIPNGAWVILQSLCTQYTVLHGSNR